MKIDLASFAFGCTLIEGTGTPPWGTALGQQRPDYKFSQEGCMDIIVGMLYNAVPLKDVWLPIGKGGSVVTGIDNPGIQLASVFQKAYVNGTKINYPFSMVIFKEKSDSHDGRRHLKYTPKISFRDEKGIVYSNEEFIAEVRNTFSLADDACWFVSELDISTQTELHMKAHFVKKEGEMVYQNSKERKEAWIKLMEK
jgi:hypothetical protein